MLEDSYSVIEDIQGYLNKRNSLPKYVSKERILSELSNILFSKRAKADKKLEALQLIDVLETKIKTEEEVNSAYAILVPAVLSQIGSPSLAAQRASLDILKRVTERRGEVLLGTLASSNGIDHGDDRISIESLKLVPGIFHKKIDTLDLTPLLEVSFKQLILKNRQSHALGALNRLKEYLGDNKFTKMTAYSVPEKLKHSFHRLSKNLDEQINYGSFRRKMDRDSFGIIPSHITNSLYNPYNRNVRSDGIRKLKDYLDSISSEEWSLIFPYMDSFLRFLGSLLDDGNMKVVLTSLEIHQMLLMNKITAEEVKDHHHIVVKNVLNIRPSSIPRINVELYQLLKLMMASLGPCLIVRSFAKELNHRKASKREDILNYIIYGLLTFPSSEFDLLDLLLPITLCVADPKKRVRHGGIECMAVISQALGPSKSKLIYKQVSELIQSPTESDRILEALQCRFSRKLLPKINEDGSIEYGLTIPRHFSNRQIGYRTALSNDPDIDWIIEGKGSLRMNQLSIIPPSDYPRIPRKLMKGIQKSHSTNSLQTESTVNKSRQTRPRKKNQRRSVSENSELSHPQNIYQSLSSREDSSSSLSADRTKVEEDYSDVEEPRLLHSDSEIDDYYYHRGRAQEHRMNALNEENPQRSLFQGRDTVDEGQYDLGARKEWIDFKKESLTTMGIATRKPESYKTIFDYENNEGSMGMRKRSDEAFEMALAQLRSSDWRSQICGMETIVQLSYFDSRTTLKHYNSALSSLLNLSKNSRSQVARAAIQAFTCLFLILGTSLDSNKLEDIADALLLRSSDTNKFIRCDAIDALEAMLNSLPIQKVSNVFCRLSSLHKNSTSRSMAAKLLANLVLQLGRERLFESYYSSYGREVLDAIVSSGTQFLLEGNPETRFEGKRLLSELAEDKDAFQSVLVDVLKSEDEVDSVYKLLTKKP